MFFSTQIKTFGLDISDRSLKVAQITKSAQGLQLTNCHKIGLPDGVLSNGEIKKENELIKHIKKLTNQARLKIAQNYVVACLPEVKTFIKLINIKIDQKDGLSEKKTEEIIKKELSHHIPLSLDDIYFDWQIINRDSNRLEILIGVAPKETVNSFTQLLKKTGLTPIALEIEAEAIVRAIFPKSNYYYSKKTSLAKQLTLEHLLEKIKSQTKKPAHSHSHPTDKKGGAIYFIIDHGASRSGLIIWADEIIKFTTSLKTSGNALTQIISQKLGLEAKKAEKLKIIYGLETKKGKTQVRKIINPAIEELCQDVIKAKEFYQNHFPSQQKKYEIILTGGSANLIGLDMEICNRLNMKVSAANPLINLTGGQKIKLNPKEIQNYTTAIGLALRSYFIKDY